MNSMFIRARYNCIQLLKLQRNWRKARFSFWLRFPPSSNGMTWHAMILILVAIPADAMICKDMFCIHMHCHSCWCIPFEGIRVQWMRIEGIRIEWIRMEGIRIYWRHTYWWDTYRMDTYWNDKYWQDTCWMDMCGMMLVRQQSSEEPCDETSFGQ